MTEFEELMQIGVMICDIIYQDLYTYYNKKINKSE